MQNLNLFKRLLRNERLVLGLIFIIALGLRLILCFSSKGLYTDDLEYHNIALGIIEGKGFVSSIRHPIYPFFLALIYLFTNSSILAVKIVQAFLGASIPLLVYYISKNILNKRLFALIPSLAVTFYPFFILYTGRIFSENLQFFSTALCFLFILKTLDNPTIKNKIFTGVLFGLCVLIKAIVLPFLPILLIWIVMFNKGPLKRGLKDAVIVSIVMVLTLAPWVIRNYVVHKDFVLISNLGGEYFWAANNPQIKSSVLKGEAKETHGLFSEETKESMKDLSLAQKDRYMYDLAFKFMRENPREVLRLGFLKMKMLWHLWPENPKKVTVYPISGEFPEFPFLKKSFLQAGSLVRMCKISFHLFYNLFFVGMFLGLFFCFRNREEKGKVLLLFLFIWIISIVIVFVSYPKIRYRIFLDPYVFIVGWYGIFNVALSLGKYLQRVNMRRLRRI